MELSKLRARLLNWGYWLQHDADIGPKGAKCISLESSYIPELGEVWSDDEPNIPTPNVADAETLEAHIRQLECLQQSGAGRFHPCRCDDARLAQRVFLRSPDIPKRASGRNEASNY